MLSNLLLTIYQSTWPNIPENFNLHILIKLNIKHIYEKQKKHERYIEKF